MSRECPVCKVAMNESWVTLSIGDHSVTISLYQCPTCKMAHLDSVEND